MVHQSVNHQGRDWTVSVETAGGPHERLDGVFGALANSRRRGMVELLALHPDSISRLAGAAGLSLPAMDKHVRILESAGLVRRRKTGRTTFLALDRSGLLALQAWIAAFHPYWGTEAETLENYGPYLADDDAGGTGSKEGS